MSQNLEKRIIIPLSATKEDLEKLNARYLASNEFEINGSKKRIEYYNLISENKLYVWKRTLPDEEKFSIHLQADITAKY